jgi:hypothetical protein
MKTTILKSSAAILAGMAVGVILSIVTDKIFESTGVMKTEPFDENPTWLIMLIVAYRTLFNIGGSYLTARLAPAKPMKHVIILGMIGLVFSVAGTIVMWHIPPHWYPISLDLLALPSAWLGGKIAMKKNINQQSDNNGKTNLSLPMV